VILTVCCAETIPPELMKKYIEYYNMKWNVGLFSDYEAMGQALKKFIKTYGYINPSGWVLIGPEGELLGRGLKGQKLRDAITKNLKTLPN
jgi:hypothetical protein